VNPQSLINECRLAGVLVNLDGGVLKLKGAPDAVRIAADRLRPFKAEIVRYQMGLMAPFQFDLMDQDIAAGNTADELRRVNNITWRLVTAKGFTFCEAIKAAAEWVGENEQHQDEAAFVDVLALFKGMQPLT
jgi:hypothetical protein